MPLPLTDRQVLIGLINAVAALTQRLTGDTLRIDFRDDEDEKYMVEFRHPYARILKEEELFKPSAETPAQPSVPAEFDRAMTGNS